MSAKKKASKKPLESKSNKKTKATKPAAKKILVVKSGGELVPIKERRQKLRRKADLRETDGEGLAAGAHGELVILTGMSGSGKASALKAFEDLGYYSVDNLPVELIPRFAELALQSGEIPRTA